MERLPKHIAIVMDGNGRWANHRKLPRPAGHRAGAKVVRKVVDYCGHKGVDVLTLFAFSLENRNRPALEVNFLMKLLLNYLRNHTLEMHKNNVCLRVIGDRSEMDATLLSEIEAAESLTINNTGITLVLAVNYSGRWDIAQASARMVRDPLFDANASIDKIEKKIQQNLSLADLPEPALLIRTSGEQRLSNFMLWQLSYTELFFTDTHWPDFTESHLVEALEFYQTRQRRFGLTPQQAALGA